MANGSNGRTLQLHLGAFLRTGVRQKPLHASVSTNNTTPIYTPPTFAFFRSLFKVMGLTVSRVAAYCSAPSPRAIVAPRDVKVVKSCSRASSLCDVSDRGEASSSHPSESFSLGALLGSSRASRFAPNPTHSFYYAAYVSCDAHIACSMAGAGFTCWRKIRFPPCSSIYVPVVISPRCKNESRSFNPSCTVLISQQLRTGRLL